MNGGRKEGPPIRTGGAGPDPAPTEPALPPG